MKPARYNELLARLLEDSLTSGEAEELASALNTSSEMRRDLREHLALWELWSQAQSEERSATRFVDSWQTRLRATNESPGEFAAAVHAKLEDFERKERNEKPDEVPGRVPSTWFGIFEGLRTKLVWGLSAAVVMIGVLWLAITRSAYAGTTIQGDGICTVCTLNRGHEHLQALRVSGPVGEQLYYFETNQITAGVYFCDGPIPVVAKGHLKTNQSRLFIAATKLTVHRR